MLAKSKTIRALLAAGGSSAGLSLGNALGVVILAVRGKGVGMQIILAVFFTGLATVCFATRQAAISEPEQAKRTLLITSVTGILVTAVTAIGCLFLPNF